MSYSGVFFSPASDAKERADTMPVTAPRERPAAAAVVGGVVELVTDPARMAADRREAAARRMVVLFLSWGRANE